ncbi:hypothetical protein ATKI12_9102 [Kitasatospora sp. Ki12]
MLRAPVLVLDRHQTGEADQHRRAPDLPDGLSSLKPFNVAPTPLSQSGSDGPCGPSAWEIRNGTHSPSTSSSVSADFDHTFAAMRDVNTGRENIPAGRSIRRGRKVSARQSVPAGRESGYCGRLAHPAVEM